MCSICRMDRHANITIPPWEAYAVLFKRVMDKQKRKWSITQLADRLNADAEQKNFTKCTYSRRSLVAYQSNSKKESARVPRPLTKRHLHQYLTEQLNCLGEMEKFEKELQAIAASHPPDDILLKSIFQETKENKSQPKQRITIPLNGLMESLQSFLSKEFGPSGLGIGNETDDPAESGVDHGYKLPQRLDALDSPPQLVNEKNQHLINARTFLNVGAWDEAAFWFLHARLDWVAELETNGQQDAQLESGLYMTCQRSAMLNIKSHSDVDAIAMLEDDLTSANMGGLRYVYGCKYRSLGTMHYMLSVNKTVAASKKNLKSAKKAYKSALSYYDQNLHPIQWYMTTINMAGMLLNKHLFQRKVLSKKDRHEGFKLLRKLRKQVWANVSENDDVSHALALICEESRQLAQLDFYTLYLKYPFKGARSWHIDLAIFCYGEALKLVPHTMPTLRIAIQYHLSVFFLEKSKFCAASKSGANRDLNTSKTILRKIIRLSNDDDSVWSRKALTEKYEKMFVHHGKPPMYFGTRWRLGDDVKGGAMEVDPC